MSTTTTTTVVSLAQHRDAGDAIGREPHATVRALMSGTATQADRLAHIVTAVREAGLIGNVTPTGAVPTARMTAQRMEILDLIAQGYSNTEIARMTFRSVDTVKSHQANLYRAFGVSTRVECVLEAIRAGVLPSMVPAEAPTPRTRARATRCTADGCTKRTTHGSGTCPAHRD